MPLSKVARKLLGRLLLLYAASCGGAPVELQQPVVPVARVPRTWVFSAGISKYKDKSFSLKYADNDASAVAEIFASAQGGGRSSERVTLLVDSDATRTNIISSLAEVAERSAEDDMIVVFLSMHATGMPGEPFYFLAHDTDVRKLLATGISEAEIKAVLSKARAKRVVMFLDTCHAGAFGFDDLQGKRALRGEETRRMLTSLATVIDRGTGVLAASGQNEYSEENERWGGGHGVFTYHLLDGLRGRADENGDGIVTLRELYDYVYPRVKADRAQEQHPNIAGNDKLPVIAVTSAPSPAPPVSASLDFVGRVSEVAARAKRLFDDEQWEAASLALKKVVDGETDDSPGNRELAEYYLAISLFHHRFWQASYALFSSIVDKPSHPKFKETAQWLARLADELPAPADIAERVGHYNLAALSTLDNPQQRALYWTLAGLLGRRLYQKGQYDEAVTALERVDPRSVWYAESQLFLGITHVRRQRSVPAIEAFRRAAQAAEKGAGSARDWARLRDLARLSVARVLYSSAFSGRRGGSPDGARLAVAIAQYRQVGAMGVYGADVRYEQAWAHYWAGNPMDALVTLMTPWDAQSFHPDAALLYAAAMAEQGPRKDARAAAVTAEYWLGVYKQDLGTILKRYGAAGTELQFFLFVKDVREGKTIPGLRDKTSSAILAGAFSDRRIEHNFRYIRLLDEEKARFETSAPAFRNSSIGVDVADAQTLARDLVIRNIASLAREQLQSMLGELDQTLPDASRMATELGKP